jgi:2'-5' RNA ligase superfamily
LLAQLLTAFPRCSRCNAMLSFCKCQSRCLPVARGSQFVGCVLAELTRLQAALVRAFPGCTELSADPERGINKFVPHFSLGQWRSAAEAEAAAQVAGAAQAALQLRLCCTGCDALVSRVPRHCMHTLPVCPLAQELAASWQPVSFRVAAVQLISRTGYHEPFRRRWEVPLGGTTDPTLLDVPYVATAGDTVMPPGSLVRCKAPATCTSGWLHDDHVHLHGCKNLCCTMHW